MPGGRHLPAGKRHAGTRHSYGAGVRSRVCAPPCAPLAAAQGSVGSTRCGLRRSAPSGPGVRACAVHHILQCPCAGCGNVVPIAIAHVPGENRAMLDFMQIEAAVRAPDRGGRTWFVSRHPGSHDWAVARGLPIDVHVHHLEVARVRRGDVVLGMLPAHLVAAVCRAGAAYYHLAIDAQPSDRGREMSAEELDAAGARLVPIFLSAGN